MTAQNQGGTQKALASVPIALGKIVLQEPSTGQSKHASLWSLSVTERRANWLRMKHPKMDVKKRERWAENAQLATAPSCSR